MKSYKKQIDEFLDVQAYIKQANLDMENALGHTDNLMIMKRFIRKKVPDNILNLYMQEKEKLFTYNNIDNYIKFSENKNLISLPIKIGERIFTFRIKDFSKEENILRYKIKKSVLECIYFNDGKPKIITEHLSDFESNISKYERPPKYLGIIEIHLEKFTMEFIETKGIFEILRKWNVEYFSTYEDANKFSKKVLACNIKILEACGFKYNGKEYVYEGDL